MTESTFVDFFLLQLDEVNTILQSFTYNHGKKHQYIDFMDVHGNMYRTRLQKELFVPRDAMNSIAAKVMQINNDSEIVLDAAFALALRNELNKFEGIAVTFNSVECVNDLFTIRLQVQGEQETIHILWRPQGDYTGVINDTITKHNST